MKRIIIELLIFIIIFNFIFVQGAYVEAVEVPEDYSYTQDDFDAANNDGENNQSVGNRNQVSDGMTQSTSGSIIGTLAYLLDLIPLGANFFMGIVANQAGIIDRGSFDASKYEDFSIENTVFGDYYLFDGNVFKDSSSYTIVNKKGEAPSETSRHFINTIDTLKKEVAKWYYIMKLLAFAIGLITLIYIGIRMAISTVSADKARYKKMLVGWVQSIIIIVALPYIMQAINYLMQLILNIITGLRNSLSTTVQSFEPKISSTIFQKLKNSGGMLLAAYSIAYFILMFAQFKFFMQYLKRMLSICFLTLISPLISITYSIDKAGDGKAQAFQAWYREYLVNMLIQPVQALLYLIFAFSASEIAIRAPIIGIIFLFSLTKAEKITRIVFNIEALTSKPLKIFGKGK